MALGFYCGTDNSSDPNYDTIFRSFMQQLVKYRPTALRSVRNLHAKELNGERVNMEEYLTALRDELSDLDRLYVVIDAVDEWSNSPKPVIELFAHLKSIGTHVNILATSRPIFQAQKLDAGYAKVDLHLPEDDLGTYIRSRLSKSDQNFLARDKLLQENVLDTVIRRSEGLYVLSSAGKTLR